MCVCVCPHMCTCVCTVDGSKAIDRNDLAARGVTFPNAPNRRSPLAMETQFLTPPAKFDRAGCINFAVRYMLAGKSRLMEIRRAVTSVGFVPFVPSASRLRVYLHGARLSVAISLRPLDSFKPGFPTITNDESVAFARRLLSYQVRRTNVEIEDESVVLPHRPKFNSDY